jgi:hypothetical protein
MHQERFPHQTTRPPSPTSQRHLSTPMAETANSPNWLQNTLERTDSRYFIENWLRLYKKEFRVRACTKQHKNAQPKHPRSPCRRVAPVPTSAAHSNSDPAIPPTPQTGSKTPWNKQIPNTLSKLGFVCPKKSFAPHFAQERTKPPKPAQLESARIAPSPARPLPRSATRTNQCSPCDYRLNTLEFGSSTTFTGAPGTGMLKLTPPSPVCTHLVNVFPCPN